MNRNPGRSNRITYKRKAPVSMYTLRRSTRRRSQPVFLTQSQESVRPVRRFRVRNTPAIVAQPHIATLPQTIRNTGVWGKPYSPYTYNEFETSKSTFMQTKPADETDFLAYNVMHLTALSQDADDPNNRKGPEIFVKGLKLFLDLQNNSESGPIFVEYSIVGPKRQSAPTLVNLLTAPGQNETGKDWGTSISAMGQQVSTINPDNYFIFMSKKVLLLHKNPDGKGTDAFNWNIKSGSSIKNLYEYIPINKSIRFDDDTSTLCRSPLYLIFRCWRFRQDTADASLDGVIAYDARVLMQYKNVDTN